MFEVGGTEVKRHGSSRWFKLAGEECASARDGGQAGTRSGKAERTGPRSLDFIAGLGEALWPRVVSTWALSPTSWAGILLPLHASSERLSKSLDSSVPQFPHLSNPLNDTSEGC